MLGGNNPQFNYFMDGRELQCIEAEKDLRVAAFISIVKLDVETLYDYTNL